MIVFDVPSSGAIVQYPSPEHPAYDFACARGESIHAVHSGEGRFEWSSRMGWTFIHTYEGRITRYSHLQTVAPPGWYERGDVIGTCGNTGTWQSGVHLHFESNQPYRF